MKSLNVCLGIFIALAVTRFIPHPPNFTSLIALSFYVPALFGVRYLPIVIVSFALTDVVLGFHSIILFTWGSVLFVGLLSNFFNRSIIFRITGALTGVMVFYLITNFGVWSGGMYGYSFDGLIMSYIMGLPFLGNNIIATFIFSALIESFYKFYKTKVKNI